MEEVAATKRRGEELRKEELRKEELRKEELREELRKDNSLDFYSKCIIYNVNETTLARSLCKGWQIDLAVRP